MTDKAAEVFRDKVAAIVAKRPDVLPPPKPGEKLPGIPEIKPR